MGFLTFELLTEETTISYALSTPSQKPAYLDKVIRILFFYHIYNFILILWCAKKAPEKNKIAKK
jgi:hypothetical protein